MENLTDVINVICTIIAIVEFICFISVAVNVSKIMTVQCKPFQNKKPDYPDKVIELLQTIVVAEQNNTYEIKKLTGEVETIRNGGAKPGVKNQAAIQHEELMKAIQIQNEILQKILDTSTGEEKRKLMEKWKQASAILGEISDNQ